MHKKTVIHRSVPRARSLGAARSAVIETLETRQLLSAAVASTNVLDYRYNMSASGVNSSEVQLTPANVGVGTFGKLATVSMDSQVYAEPLVDNGVTITAGVNTVAAATGVHNVVYVATENDTIYAMDTLTGSLLWKRSFLDATNPKGNVNNTLGATSIVSLSDADVGLPNSGEEWGLTGTPVIDGTTNILYVVVRTKETIGGAIHFVQRLHAVNLSDGTDAATPFLIGDTSGTFSSKGGAGAYINNTPLYVYGTGYAYGTSTTATDAVIDPYNATGKSVVQFNALRELQRPALNLVNNQVYVAWASNGDNGPYHGFIASWNVANIKTTGFALSGVLCTCPNTGESGIWQSGGALAFEPDGSAFFAMTGNGSGEAPTLNAAGMPSDATYNESLIKVVADPMSTAAKQNPNGWGMKVASFFMPSNVVALDNADSDFGSGAPLILPPSAGIAGHPNLIVAAGKDGRVFVLDANNLGGYHATYDNVINAVVNSQGVSTAPSLIHGTLSTPTYFNGKLYLVAGYLGNAKAFTISSTGQLVASSSSSAQSFGSLPGGPTVSANGTANGIAWMINISANALYAYNANSLGTLLWTSNQAAGGADALGAALKFAEPTIANGEVFVGTQNSLVIYGLTPPSSVVPVAPVLSAAALSATSVNLTWTDATAAPNTATGYTIQDSTDGKTYATATTVPAGATSVAIGALTASTKYYFRIEGVNAVGDSLWSTPAQVTTPSGSGVTTGVSPNAPTGLGASPASAISVYLTWTANSTNQTGYQLDRATDINFTLNLVTQTLPASGTSYTDTAVGLAPGLTFYYRLRAFNTAGASGNSNSTPAVIPNVPAKPSNQVITNVTTNEIDMSWTDNAGHSADDYLILRAVDHGSFTTVADLPPTSRPAPSQYGWSDTNVTPGNYYEYHIEAVNVAGHNDFAGVNATSITTAPMNVTSSPDINAVDLYWTAVPGAASYNVYRSTTPGGEGAVPVADDIQQASYQDPNLTPGVTYYYVVTAVNPNATYTMPLPSESAPSAEVSAAPLAPAAAVLSSTATVGAPALGGSATVTNGVYTINGSGVDIWNQSDQFEYDYAAANGDTTIAARVTSVQLTHTWAKAGVMIRDGTAANAMFADVVVTPAGYVSFQWRTTTGATAQRSATVVNHVPPQWVKLIRTGNSFAGFYSVDGVTWIQIGAAQPIAMPTLATAGLAVTSVRTDRVCTATIDNVSLVTNPVLNGKKPATIASEVLG